MDSGILLHLSAAFTMNKISCVKIISSVHTIYVFRSEREEMKRLKNKKMRTARVFAAMLLIFTMVFFAGCSSNDDMTDGTTDNPPVTDNDATNPDDTVLDDNDTMNNDNGDMTTTDDAMDTTDSAVQ